MKAKLVRVWPPCYWPGYFSRAECPSSGGHRWRYRYHVYCTALVSASSQHYEWPAHGLQDPIQGRIQVRGRISPIVLLLFINLCSNRWAEVFFMLTKLATRPTVSLPQASVVSLPIRPANCILCGSYRWSAYMWTVKTRTKSKYNHFWFLTAIFVLYDYLWTLDSVWLLR